MIFSFFFIVTILFGTCLSSHSIDLLPFYCLYFVLAFYVLASFDYGQDYYLSFQMRAASKTENKLLVAGHEMKSDVEEDKQEDRFLNLFAPNRLVKRNFLNGAISFGGLWFFYSKLGAEISLNTLIPLVGCFLVMNSFYVGHLLVVLLLNSVIVTYNYSTDVPMAYYFLYICLFLSSLCLIANHKESFKGRKIINLVVLGLVFLTCNFAFSWILPNSSPPIDLKSELTRSESRMLRDFVSKNKDQLLKLSNSPSFGKKQGDIPDEIAKSLAEMESLEQVLRSNSFTEKEKRELLERMNNFSDQQRSLNDKLGKQSESDLNKISFSDKEKEILNGMKIDQTGKLSTDEQEMVRNYINRAQGAGISKKEIQEVSKFLEPKEFSGTDKQNLKDALSQTAKEGPLERMNSFSDQQRSLNDKLGKQSESDLNKISFSDKEKEILNGMKIDQTGKLSTDEQEMVRNYINRAQGAGISKKEIQEVSKFLEPKEFSGTDKQNLKDALSQTAKEAPLHEKLKLPSEKEKAEIFNALTNKHDSNKIMEKLKRIFPFLVGLFFILLINYFLKKKGVKKVEAFDPETLIELKAEWKALRKLSLSPRDEVIHYYNLFHNSLQKIHYSAHEAPPSCIIYDDMIKNNFELHRPTLVITDVFARCYYGEADVTSDSLKIFRKALWEILRVYQLI